MENFIIERENNFKLTGYTWDIKDPKKVVCIIHGIGEHAGRYDRMAIEFNKNAIAVFAMDLRGHGKSDGKRGDCAPRDKVLSDIDELMDVATGAHPGVPLVLYGHSMGGNITLDYRNRGNKNEEPVGYVVSAPWVKLVRGVPKPLYVCVKGASKILPKLSISSSVDASVLGNKKHTETYTKDMLTHKKISLRCAVDGFDIGNALYDDRHEIKGNGRRKPMLLMHGDADKICDIAGSKKICQNQKGSCRFIAWEGLYHEIHNGGEKSEGDEVIKTAIDWILAL